MTVVKAGKNYLRRIMRSVWILSAVYVFSISAILRTAFHYKDDIGRTFRGYQEWERSSRYLSNLLSMLLHTDRYLTDISPMTQILAAVVMALACVMMASLFTEGKIGWRHLAAVFPAAVNPYFLECFSFQFDSIYMALSVFFSVVPLLFAQTQPVIYFAVSVLSLLGRCMSYQASSGIYPLLVLLLAFRNWNTGRRNGENRTFLFTSVLAYCFSMLFYRYVLVTQIAGYSAGELPSAGGTLRRLVRKYIYFYGQVILDFRDLWMLLLFLIILFWLVRMLRESVRKWYISLGMSVLVLFIVSLLPQGVYLLFEENLFAPRMMLGFGVMTGALTVMMVSGNDEECKGRGRILKNAGIAAAFALGWCFFSFAFTYGNALLEQQRYTDDIATTLVIDLASEDIMLSDTEKTVWTEGDIGLAPSLKGDVSHYPVLLRMLPVTLGNYKWADYQLTRYYALGKLEYGKAGKRAPGELPLLSETVYYTVQGNDKNLLITFKTKPMKKLKPDYSKTARVLLDWTGLDPDQAKSKD